MDVDTTYLSTRDDLPADLHPLGLTRLGIELGVATGRFSEQLLRNAPIRRLYSVDAFREERDAGWVVVKEGAGEIG